MAQILALQTVKSLEDDDITFPCFSIWDSTISFAMVAQDGS